MSPRFGEFVAGLLKEFRSLRSALILTVVAGVAIPAGMTSYMERQRLAEYFSEQLQADLERTCETFAVGVQKALWDVYPEDANAIIAAAISDKRVIAIEVRNKRNEMFASRQRTDKSYRYAKTLTTQVKMGESIIGSVTVTMDGEQYYRQLDEALEKDIRSALQSLCGSLLLILLVLQTRLIKPIRQLVDASAALATGNLATPITTAHKDEIGQLARSMEATRQALAASFNELEQRVEQRTAALTAANAELSEAHRVAEHSHQQAMQALESLHAAQDHLIQSEKMASLGQLVANVAHEINTPIGAVKASGMNIADAMSHALENLPALFEVMNRDERQVFMKLIDQGRHRKADLTTREERALVKEVSAQLEAMGVPDARYAAGILVLLGAQNSPQDYLALLKHAESNLILDTANCIAAIIENTGNINSAVERVSKIVFALKSFSHFDSTGEMSDSDVQEGIETVLTIYQNQIKQGIRLVRDYEEIPPLRCLPDELNQVWTNLIHNAMQAMGQTGTLTIGLRRIGNEAVISMGDTGCGIPEENRGKIFNAFFTTKPAGQGSGLGLDIVRKIVDKHKGRIEYQSQVGVGTTFQIFIPYPEGK